MLTVPRSYFQDLFIFGYLWNCEHKYKHLRHFYFYRSEPQNNQEFGLNCQGLFDQAWFHLRQEYQTVVFP